VPRSVCIIPSHFALKPVYNDATQLNSTRLRVELSCVAINGPLGYVGRLWVRCCVGVMRPLSCFMLHTSCIMYIDMSLLFLCVCMFKFLCIYHLLTSDRGRGICFCPCSFVCLSVCPWARLLKKACMDLNEMLRVDRCRNMGELINFWAWSGLQFGCRNRIAFSDIVCAATRNCITSRKFHL